MTIKNLIKRKDLPRLMTRLRRARRRVVFTNGVFDVLHRGHVDYLARAKSFGDILIVGLNTDTSARRLKGANRPIHKQGDRAAILLALRSVDYVVMFGEATPDALIRQVRPDVLAKGADYEISEIVGADFVQSYGGIVKRIRLTRGRSTTAVLQNLKR
ncbi:MAG: D-glycero-beta-D-manno-heptose 1-phosphate adenylyltransferase [candidate division Zixibacteria bacterium]|nr:D-glycero-beta-D-manno-heptose 1-phosphate adenylyltransferase [candidate division Zixibacteria bacterium]